MRAPRALTARRLRCDAVFVAHYAACLLLSASALLARSARAQLALLAVFSGVQAGWAAFGECVVGRLETLSPEREVVRVLSRAHRVPEWALRGANVALMQAHVGLLLARLAARLG
jgi:hypothetical protein